MNSVKKVNQMLGHTKWRFGDVRRENGTVFATVEGFDGKIIAALTFTESEFTYF
jgi:hypothetical protein